MKPNHSNRLVAKIVELPCIEPVMKGRWVSQSYYGVTQNVPDQGDDLVAPNELPPRNPQIQ